MKGAHLRIVSLPWSPYTIMNPINGTGDVFEMTGFYAEIWHNLQVIKIYTFLSFKDVWNNIVVMQKLSQNIKEITALSLV